MKHLPLTLCLVLAAPAVVAQDLGIRHEPVGCMVAGKFPRLSACFTPSSQVGRARVYFRAASGAGDWYFVEMKSDTPCHGGTLPRPKPELVGQTVEYYVEVADRSFAPSRTEEFRAAVVASASECDPKLPIPALLDKAAVAVFPALPAGFAGAGAGLGTTAIVVGGGAALAGGTVAVVAGGDGESGGRGTAVTTTPPDTFPPPTITTTTTTTLLGFSPVFKVLKAGVAIDPKAAKGPEPLELTFDMCDSVGPYKLSYGVEVDGVAASFGCGSTLVFTSSGVKPRGASVRPSATSRIFDVRMWMVSLAENKDPQAELRLSVEVTGAAAGACATDTAGPSVALDQPANGASFLTAGAYPVRFESSASDTRTGGNGVARVEYKVDYGGPHQLVLGPVTSSPYTYLWSAAAVESWLGADCERTARLEAYAVDGCDNTTLSSPVTVTLRSTATACSVPPAPTGNAGSGAIVSELLAPGAGGQLVVEGEAFFVGSGSRPVALRPGGRQRRIEATLVDARGPGLWRFDLSTLPGVDPESVRVLAGEPIQMTGTVLVFRLRGRPGERIVFSFGSR